MARGTSGGHPGRDLPPELAGGVLLDQGAAPEAVVTEEVRLLNYGYAFSYTMDDDPQSDDASTALIFEVPTGIGAARRYKISMSETTLDSFARTVAEFYEAVEKARAAKAEARASL